MVNHKCTLPQKIELSATSAKLHEASSQAICNGYYYYNSLHCAEGMCQLLVSSVLPVSGNHCHIWWQRPKGLWCSMNTVHVFFWQQFVQSCLFPLNTPWCLNQHQMVAYIRKVGISTLWLGLAIFFNINHSIFDPSQKGWYYDSMFFTCLLWCVSHHSELGWLTPKGWEYPLVGLALKSSSSPSSSLQIIQLLSSTDFRLDLVIPHSPKKHGE